LAGLDGAIETGQATARDREVGQAGLFGAPSEEEESDGMSLPTVPEMDKLTRLAHEKEMLGFYVTGHPLEEYEDCIAELAECDSVSIAGKGKGLETAMCGVLTGIQRERNREGRAWAVASLEDQKGSTEILIFANQYESLFEELVNDRPVLLRGQVRKDDSSPPKLSVNEIVALDNTRVNIPAQVALTIRLGNGSGSGAEVSAKLRALIDDKPGDTDLRLRILRQKEYMVLYDLADRVRGDKAFREAAEKICGKGSVEILAAG
jgi:DNA polymerase-3 subunit alpha